MQVKLVKACQEIGSISKVLQYGVGSLSRRCATLLAVPSRTEKKEAILNRPPRRPRAPLCLPSPSLPTLKSSEPKKEPYPQCFIASMPFASAEFAIEVFDALAAERCMRTKRCRSGGGQQGAGLQRTSKLGCTSVFTTRGVPYRAIDPSIFGGGGRLTG